MIGIDDILKGKKLPEEYEPNLFELLTKLNKVFDAYQKPMVVTSGFRTIEDHLRIYKKKGITNKANIPMKSKHLTCQAVDILDEENELQEWVIDHILLVEKIGLWMEAFESTPNWVHFQIVPPSSKKRFFNP